MGRARKLSAALIALLALAPVARALDETRPPGSRAAPPVIIERGTELVRWCGSHSVAFAADDFDEHLFVPTEGLYVRELGSQALRKVADSGRSFPVSCDSKGRYLVYEKIDRDAPDADAGPVRADIRLYSLADSSDLPLARSWYQWSWSFDDRKLLATRHPGGDAIVSVEDDVFARGPLAGVTLIRRTPPRDVSYLGWDPDSQHVFGHDRLNHRVFREDVATGKRREIPSPIRVDDYDVFPTRSGVIFTPRRSASDAIWLCTSDLTFRKIPAPAPFRDRAFSVDRDGRTVLSRIRLETNVTHLMMLDRRSGVISRRASAPTIELGGFSPDGRSFAYFFDETPRRTLAILTLR